MSNKSKFLAVLLACISLSACASFRNHFSSWTTKSDSEYLKAQSTPPLKVPNGLSANKVGDSYIIPASYGQGPVPVSILPPGGVYKTKLLTQPKETNSSKYFLKPLF